jgi:uncharacterized membrane protein
MPSKGMLQFKVAFYPEQAEQLERVVKEQDVPYAKLLREAFMFLLEDPEALKYVVAQAKKANYRSTGANVGLWKQTQIRKYVNGKKRNDTQTQNCHAG